MTPQRRLLQSGGILIAAILFVAVNILAAVSLRHARLDMTANGLYTLSGGSKNVLKGLREPITLRFFFSDKLGDELPQLRIYGSRVRELLEEYAALSQGRIRLEVIDPEPFTDAEDRAVQAGIQALPLDRGGRSFYFGLVGTNSVDDQQVIPYFQQEKEQFLEYDLTKLVYALSRPKKPVIGIISSLPLDFGPGGMMAAMRGQSQPYMVMTQLRQLFEVRTLEATAAAIPDDIGVLVLAHPKDLNPSALYAIDQFVLRGGRLIALVDPWSETAAAMPNPMTGMALPAGDNSSALPELFKAWGIAMDDGQFVADLGLAQRVQTGEAGPRSIVDYVAWLNVQPAMLSSNDVVTADLGALNLASAGALRPAEGATTTFTPLIRSSDQAMLVPVAKIRFRPDPTGLLQEFKATGERYVLAARIGGTIKSAFPDGPPPAEKKDAAGADNKADDGKTGAAAPVEPLKESKGPVNIIVMSDVDLLDDRFWVRTQEMFGQRVAIPIAANADFLINAIDNLAGSNDLIALRSRGRSQRPFEAVETLRRTAEQQFLSRERALQKKLEETEKKIADLQTKAQGSAASALLGAEEQSAIEGFRTELVQTRQELRAVQRDLNRDIESLEAGVKFVNVGLMPIAIGVIAAGVAALRRGRRRRPKPQEG